MSCNQLAQARKIVRIQESWRRKGFNTKMRRIWRRTDTLQILPKGSNEEQINNKILLKKLKEDEEEGSVKSKKKPRQI